MKKERTITEWAELAEWIATAAHTGQFRHDGVTPFSDHPKAVAFAVEDRLKPIAWLHDVVEDTPVTIEELRELGFPDYVTDAVDLLTHRNREPNVLYWNRMLVNPDAVTVKIADIKHNLSSNPTERSKKKYAQALQLFKAAGYQV